jgi:steroid delta-isomerase-like uncharacterized protein
LLVDFLRRVWDEGDAGVCEQFLARSYTIHHDPGDPWAGQTLDLAGYQDRLRVSRAPFPDQCFDIVGLFEDGDVVVATWHWHATHLGDMPGFPATGQRLTMSGTTAYSFVNDRISGHWQVVDRLSVFQQLQAQRGAE